MAAANDLEKQLLRVPFNESYLRNTLSSICKEEKIFFEAIDKGGFPDCLLAKGDKIVLLELKIFNKNGLKETTNIKLPNSDTVKLQNNWHKEFSKRAENCYVLCKFASNGVFDRYLLFKSSDYDMLTKGMTYQNLCVRAFNKNNHFNLKNTLADLF